MTSHDSNEALRRYVRDRSEPAFRQLVEWHSGLVHGTAMRRLAGNRAAAQDVTQEVFTLLARQAPQLAGVTLSAWLYRQTWRLASNHLRAEARRKKREMVAAESIASAGSSDGGRAEYHALAPEMDEALLALPGRDRDILTMRYFDSRNFRSVADLLGISEEAARKRTGRALDKLAAGLRRQGVKVAAATLGTTLSGWASSPVPLSAAAIDGIASEAIKNAPVGGSAGLWTQAGFFSAGMAMVGLIAVAHAAWRPAPLSAETHATPPAAHERAEMKTVVAADEFEQLLATIQRYRKGPGDVMAKLRLDAAFEALPFDRVGPFILWADPRLSRLERETAYRPLLEHWIDHDPAGAMTFALDQRLAPKVREPAYSSHLMQVIFEPWAQKDPVAAEKWLLQSWDDPNLKEAAFTTTLGDEMASEVADQYLVQRGAEAALAFVGRLPADTQPVILDTLAAWNGGYHTMWINLSAKARLDLYRAFVNWPDRQLGRRLANLFLYAWRRESPRDFLALDGVLTPSEKFFIAVQSSDVQEPEVIDRGGGSREVRYKMAPRPTFEELDRSTLCQAEEAGVNRQEALQTIAEKAISGASLTEVREPMTAWLEKHHGEVTLDRAISGKVAGMINYSKYGSYVGAADVEDAIAWSAFIRDPDLRLRLSRSAFRCMLVKDRGYAAQWLEKNDLSPEMKDEFQQLLSKQP